MVQRIITGVVGISALIAILYVRGWVSSLAVTLICLLGLYEEYQAFKTGGHKPAAWPGLCAALLLWPAYAWKGPNGILPLLVLAMLLTMLWIVRRKEPSWIDAAASLYPLLTVFLPMSLFLILLDGKRFPVGITLVVLTFVISFAGDIFAYFIGSFFGWHKLCPAVSPKNTVEWSIAGLVGGVLTCIAAFYLCARGGLPTPGAIDVVVLALIGGVAGQVGDLTASLVKRHCGIKDFGSIFPGHGGIMDRMDSVLFTLVVVCAYCLLYV